ncbi:hypothetical protein [Paenibacillus koleovorans]|uniref:hypothetical protein n=1 Tax=Paenibacillus koleovorans TaxID=121608 RepID=UPI000FD8401F|nr:hypothetical protein [Paenibacillus koleovorans]
MSASRMAEVAVLLDREAAIARWARGENVFERFVVEVLEHAGIPFRVVECMQQLIGLDDNAVRPDVLIAALEPEAGSENHEAMWKFAEEGGMLISFAGLDAFAPRLGCVVAGGFGPGYARLTESLGDPRPLRFLLADVWRASGTVPVEEQGALLAGSPNGEPIGAALQRFAVGRGSIHRWAVDLPGTWVGLQQGTQPVTKDGVPAPDGTAAIDDKMLKADDGFELDWVHDRVQTDTGFNYFPHPYSDLWKEAFIGQLLSVTLEAGVPLPFVGYWPDGVEQVALISHDSDRNEDETAITTLRVLKECDIRSTWCMLEPGFHPSIYEQVVADGHELAFHYNGMAEQKGGWSEAEFDRQFAWLQEATGIRKFASNKNHYTRVEGWGEYFRWCEKHGIETDQTRGASKRGNIGYLFGTCHPYFPIAWADEQNRSYDVLENGFLTQDLDHERLADSSVLMPFLEHAKRVQGVAHFLFHQFHIHNQPRVTDALRKVVRVAHEEGFTFMTGQEINDWERARRHLRVERLDEQGGAIVSSSLADAASRAGQAVVWIPRTLGGEAGVDEGVAMKFGVRCVKQVAAF